MLSPPQVGYRVLLQADQAEYDHQVPAWMFGECCEDPSLGSNLRLSAAGLDDSGAQKSAYNHRGLKNHRSFNPFQVRYM